MRNTYHVFVYTPARPMSVLGMPTGMFLVFVATLVAGSLGAAHFVIVHLIMGKPVDENIRGEDPSTARDGGSEDV